jgi:hypothetical protein
MVERLTGEIDLATPLEHLPQLRHCRPLNHLEVASFRQNDIH